MKPLGIQLVDVEFVTNLNQGFACFQKTGGVGIDDCEASRKLQIIG